MPPRSLRKLLAVVSLILIQSWHSTATPLPTESVAGPELVDLVDLQNVTISELDNGCQNPCGYGGWLCCAVSQTCITDSNNQAQCADYATTAAPQATATGGYWQYWTSTWVQTDLITMTTVYSSYVGPTAAAAPTTYYPPAESSTPTSAPLTCDWADGESSCGNICCSNTEYCVVAGQCGPAASFTSAPTSFSAPLRPTSSGIVIETATTTTTTVGFFPALPTASAVNVNVTSSSDNGGGGLSGGAIAGIVIAVIFAIIILLLLCLILCFRSAWHGLLGIFGLGPKERRRTEVEYDAYYRRDTQASGGRQWYPGSGPGRIERTERVERKSGGVGWGGVAAALTGFGVALGLSRRNENKKRTEKSDVSSSYASYSDYTYDSVSSSDRRTRDTRRSRRL